MHSTYLTIYNQINKETWICPTIFGVVGGITGMLSSNLSIGSQIIFNALYWTIGYKIILVMAGAGMGWQLGLNLYNPKKAIDELVKNKDLWTLIMNSYEPDDTKIDYKRTTAIEILLDTRLDIGKLYQFCCFLFIERYEYISSNEEVLNEFKYIVRILTVKHPMYHKDCEHELLDLIERRTFNDLYPYIYGHYLVKNSSSHKKMLPITTESALEVPIGVSIIPINAIKTTDNKWFDLLFSDIKNKTPELKDAVNKILLKASNEFRRLPNEIYPKDKAELLINMVKILSDDFQKLDINISCDLLIPIVSFIIMKNIDIVPGAEIKMIYDYLGHLSNEEGFMVTVLLSSLMVCINDNPNDDF